MAGVIRSTIRRVTAFAPSRRLVAVAALSSPVWLLSGTPTGQTIAMVVVVAIAIAAGFDIATLPSQSAIDVTRHFPGNIGVGDHGAGRYDIHSRWPRSLVVSPFDRLPAAIHAGPMDARLPIAARGQLRIDRQFTGVRRGDHELGPVALRVEGTLGRSEEHTSELQSQ